MECCSGSDGARCCLGLLVASAKSPLTACISLMMCTSAAVLGRHCLCNHNTRITQFLQLNVLYYAYMVISSLIMPLVYKGDGRFYTFLLATNSIFILFFLSLLNPFYITSSRFPQLEGMTSLRFLFFCLFEGLAYVAMALFHQLWGYYLVTRGLSAQGRAPRMLCFFAAEVTIPSILLVFTAALQLGTRVGKLATHTAIYDSERVRSNWSQNRARKRIERQQHIVDRMITKRVIERSLMNYR